VKKWYRFIIPDTMKLFFSISSQEIIKNKQCGYDVRKPGYVSIICLIYKLTIMEMHGTFYIHGLYRVIKMIVGILTTCHTQYT